MESVTRYGSYVPIRGIGIPHRDQRSRGKVCPSLTAIVPQSEARMHVRPTDVGVGSGRHYECGGLKKQQDSISACRRQEIDSQSRNRIGGLLDMDRQAEDRDFARFDVNEIMRSFPETAET